MLKKFVSLLLFAVIFNLFTPAAVFAGNKVSDINVDVFIYQDGSAYITQTWNCDFSQGTEGYIPIQNLGDMTISDFLVSDGNGPYQVEKDWDINGSFEEKAGKCGILKTPDGYELCWGITNYGQNRYAIEYKIHQFVGSYEDFDGFNFQFINPGMGTLPTDVTVKIVMQDGIQLDESNSGIWAFGFDGQIHFDNGQVVAYTASPLSATTDNVIIMMQLNKGLIQPIRKVDAAFSAVKDQAFEGSSYDSNQMESDAVLQEEYSDEDPGAFFTIIGGITLFLPAIIVIYIIRRLRKPKKQITQLYENAEYFREVPFAGNIEATFALAEEFNQIGDDNDLIGAAFLKLINGGCLEPLTEKKVSFFGKERESISLKLVHPPEFPGLATGMLYDLLITASSLDQILQEHELEKYCERNQRALKTIIDAAREDGRRTLLLIDCYAESSKKNPLGLSDRGKKLIQDIMGFKKYLLEFSLIGERSVAESIIWQDYLTFATLLGIADKVIAQFEKVYPDATEYNQNAHYSYLLAHTFMVASARGANANSSSGLGGAVSMLGGSGFSGGGSGGGTR